jgi:hypothetical protein
VQHWEELTVMSRFLAGVQAGGIAIALFAAAPAAAVTQVPAARVAGCPAGKVVSTAAQLAAALKAAGPGTVIDLTKGTYAGSFTATTSGTKARPITLCGAADAVIDGKGASHILYLNGASWWRLSGFQITDGDKGLTLAHASFDTVTRLYIHGTTGPAVHVNSFSSDNVFNGVTVKGTRAEGFYIGSARHNWCLYSGCKPDRSDRNVIENCVISGIVYDPINIKEGTTGGELLDNRINGAGDSAKDWINVKGNSYLIEGNVGVNSRQDGYDVHVILPGWGQHNVFTGNSGTVNGSGYGFYIQPGAVGNTVACGQKVTGAALGYSNVACG